MLAILLAGLLAGPAAPRDLAMQLLRAGRVDTSRLRATERRADGKVWVLVEGGSPPRRFRVDFASDGRIRSALNESLAAERKAGRHTPDGVRPRMLSAQACRARLRQWMMGWPPPKGHEERSFQYLDAAGDAVVVCDRRVAGSWLDATSEYAIDVRTGILSRFSAPRDVALGTTSLACSKLRAEQTARAAIRPWVAQYGEHRLERFEIGFLHRPGSRPASWIADLGYRLHFVPATRTPKNRMYRGVGVQISGSTGRVMGEPRGILIGR